MVALFSSLRHFVSWKWRGMSPRKACAQPLICQFDHVTYLIDQPRVAGGSYWKGGGRAESALPLRFIDNISQTNWDIATRFSVPEGKCPARRLSLKAKQSVGNFFNGRRAKSEVAHAARPPPERPPCSANDAPADCAGAGPWLAERFHRRKLKKLPTDFIVFGLQWRTSKQPFV